MAMTGATIGKFGLIVNREDNVTGRINQRVARLHKKIHKHINHGLSLLL
jgi:hypothetical protein